MAQDTQSTEANSRVLVRDLKRITYASEGGLALIDTPSESITNSISVSNLFSQLMRLTKKTFFPSTEGLDWQNMSNEEIVINAYINPIKTYTHAVDTLIPMDIREGYYSIFIRLIVNTDWLEANGQDLPATSLHRILGDNITKTSDLRGRAIVGVDATGSSNSDNTGLYAGETQEDAAQRIRGEAIFFSYTNAPSSGVLRSAQDIQEANIIIGDRPGTRVCGLSFDNSRQARVSSETRMKNTKTVWIQRVKMTNL